MNDVLAWVIGPGLPIGGAAALLLFIIKNPEKLARTIPRVIAAWRNEWAKVDESKLHQLEARAALLDFEDKAANALGDLETIPSGNALSGPGTYKLEILGPCTDLNSDDSKPNGMDDD